MQHLIILACFFGFVFKKLIFFFVSWLSSNYFLFTYSVSNNNIRIQTFESLRIILELHKHIPQSTTYSAKYTKQNIQNASERQSCVRGFHFFQDFWQHKFREILNASNKDKTSSLVRDRIQLRVNIKTEELLGMFLNMYQSKCISSLNMVKK